MAERVRIRQAVDRLELIRKKPLAKLLGVRPETINNWRRRGLMPQPIRFTAQIVAWRRADIDRWLQEKQEMTNA